VGDSKKTDRGDVPAGLDGLDDMDLPERRTPGRGARDGVRLDSRETLERLLDDDTLGVTEDEARGTTRRIQPNPVGLKKGYDPYDSGMLVKKQWKKKKDLRALSEWIEKKKRDG
jgi:hypothetical protein